MANAHAVDKKGMGFRFDLELWALIQRAARIANITPTDFVVMSLTKATQHIELTSEDYEAIAQEVRKNERRRKAATNSTHNTDAARTSSKGDKAGKKGRNGRSS